MFKKFSLLLTKYKIDRSCTVLVFILTGFVSSLSAQFNPKPDSLVSKFGPKTTIYYQESHYLMNDFGEPKVIDTVMSNSHLFQSYYDVLGSPKQDLGAYGSSQKAYYLEAPTELGASFGYHAWDAFNYTSEEIRYYDSHSPYSRLEYVQGLDGQQIFNAEFSRSASENFNFGFHLRRFTTNRMIGKNTEKDRFGDNLSANINLRIQTSNKRYLLLANYRFMKQTQFETGGFYDKSTDSTSYDYFEDDFATTNLSGPESELRDNTWHVYQQFNLSKDTSLNGKLQLFNVFERKKQRFSYIDTKLNVQRTEIDNRSNGDFYDNIYFDSTATLDSNIYTVFENKLGIKGTIGNTYYQAYLRRRDYNYTIYDTLDLGWKKENYIGGVIRQRFSDSVMLDIQVEYSDVDLYKYVIRPTYKGATLTYASQKVKPDVIQSYYVGNHFLWSRDLHNYQIDKLEFSYKFKKGKTQAKPFVGHDQYTDLIYFDDLATPQQDDKTISAPYAGLNFESSWRRFHLSGFLKYYEPSDKNIVRAPKVFWYQQIYYESHFQNNLFFQLGADMYMRSSYDAYAFMPATQQFYTRENDVTNSSTLVVDAFINFRLKSALLFLKVPAVNELISGEGYFLTPDYPGVKTTFVFGVEWMFFD
jgi:hypothetical protein